jgi:hypothetical protein
MNSLTKLYRSFPDLKRFMIINRKFSVRKRFMIINRKFSVRKRFMTNKCVHCKDIGITKCIQCNGEGIISIKNEKPYRCDLCDYSGWETCDFCYGDRWDI